MSPAPTAPLSHPVVVDDLPQGGIDVTIAPTESQRAALAADLDIPAIGALEGRFVVEKKARGARVTGEVTARVTQICSVTLEPFDADIREEVDVSFSYDAAETEADEGVEHGLDHDPPDPIVDGRIDLGHLTAEFLALGLDPYPRKPGAVFVEPSAAPARESPFAVLAARADAVRKRD